MDEIRIEQAIRSRVEGFEKELREVVKEWRDRYSEDVYFRGREGRLMTEEEKDKTLLDSIEMWYVE